MKLKNLWTTFIVILLLGCSQQPKLTPSEAQAIAEEAYIYANPMADNYSILYNYFVDTSRKDFKADWTEFKNLTRVYTHEDDRSDDRLRTKVNVLRPIIGLLAVL